MAALSDSLLVLKRLGEAFNQRNFPSLSLKPLQVKCFDYILRRQDVIAILPTVFGNSLLFQVLPDFLPCKNDSNIVVVVCPLNSIIEDQKVLKERNE